MRTILAILFVFCMSAVFAQTGQINKNITFQDTTLGKCFFNYDSYYDVNSKKLTVEMHVFTSKKSLLFMTNQINAPEVFSSITIDLSGQQDKTLSQIDNITRIAIKTKLKEDNPTWTNADIIFYQ